MFIAKFRCRLMTAHAYSEDQLVEQPAIGLFAELGWTTVSVMEELFGGAKPSPRPSPSGRGSDAGPANLGRETSGEVVLAQRLKITLEKLNPGLPSEAITSALDELTRDRSAMIPVAANREIYELLKGGVKVTVPDRDRGGQKEERVRVIDWETPAENDFLLVSQMKFASETMRSSKE
ncbi:MAG: type I restriction enzyme R subunit [Mariniblastus sp.]|jgi:type I restriction enzyme R subunit